MNSGSQSERRAGPQSHYLLVDPVPVRSLLRRALGRRRHGLLSQSQTAGSQEASRTRPEPERILVPDGSGGTAGYCSPCPGMPPYCRWRRPGQ